MKIILSGVTGLIGKKLVRALTPGHELVVVGRDASRARKTLQSPGINFVAWSDPVETLAEHFKDCDAVINLAGAGIADKPWTAARKQELISSRIDPVYHLACLLASAGEKPKVVIQASATGYYGQTTEGEFTEESPKGEGFLAEITEIWEGAATEFERISDRIVILRTGIVLDKEAGALPQMIKPFRFFAGGPLGSGKQWISWIHLDDVVQSILFLLGNDKANGPYNLTAPYPVRQTAFARLIGRQIGKPSLLPVPAFALRLVLGKNMADELLLGGGKVMPAKLLSEGFTFAFPHAEDALNDIL